MNRAMVAQVLLVTNFGDKKHTTGSVVTSGKKTFLVQTACHPIGCQNTSIFGDT
jgi:hypothetical protein